MKQNPVGLGVASLILIFSVLCLAIFAILTLASANREQSLTEKLKTSTAAYYEADSRAVEIEAKLRAAIVQGEVPESIDGIPITVTGETVSYNCPIDQRRALSITLTRDGGALRVIAWREMNVADWTPQEGVDVWKGEPNG